MEEQTKIVPFAETDIRSRILTIRGVQVMLDRDLAELYGVKTKALNQAVKRNVERFPERFMFRLIESEMNELVTKCDRFKNQKHASVPMCAFTEQGVAMLSGVLKSRVAIEVNIRTEILKFNRQYKDLSVTYTDDFHDRFLIIDNVELHNLGSSINSLGRRVTSYSTRDPNEIAKLCALLPNSKGAK